MSSASAGQEFDDRLVELRQAEMELMVARENVAAMRRDMPPGPVAGDYSFVEIGADGAEHAVGFDDLCPSSDRPLVLYHFMFGGRQTSPCPMCAMWADGWNAVAHHLAERVEFAMVSDAPIATTMDLVETAGWTNLRWLSSSDTSFKVDIGGADTDGNQWPCISAWHRDDDVVRQSYCGTAQYDDDHFRGLDLLTPVWNVLDLTRSGRGDWFPSPPHDG